MKRLVLTLTLAALVASSAAGKTLSQDCNNTLVNLGACSAGQVGNPGALIFYWLPQARALEIRDAFLAIENYQAQILCTNEPTDKFLVKPWDASVAYIEQGHCLQSEALTMVPNPISQNQWVDFQVRLHVRRQLRSHRIKSEVSAVADPVRIVEQDKPVEQFEENPD